MPRKPESRKQQARKNPGQFKKGQSGNPGGRPKVVGHVRELAREYTAEAIETLAEIMKHSPHDSARVAASTHLLDRGYGKPAQSVDVNYTQEVERMSREEIEDLLEQHRQVMAASGEAEPLEH